MNSRNSCKCIKQINSPVIQNSKSLSSSLVKRLFLDEFA